MSETCTTCKIFKLAFPTIYQGPGDIVIYRFVKISNMNITNTLLIFIDKM